METSWGKLDLSQFDAEVNGKLKTNGWSKINARLNSYDGFTLKPTKQYLNLKNDVKKSHARMLVKKSVEGNEEQQVEFLRPRMNDY